MPQLLRDELLSEIFAATVARTPNAPALRTGEGVLTYLDVDARAEALACGLAARGLAPGRIAGLWMARGAELLVAQVAVAKTGAAWLPFDADAPLERIAICLADAEAVLLVTSEAFAAKAADALPCPIVTDIELAAVVASCAPTNARAAGAQPDSPAYLIYTSGSTGVPKGIVISNSNICHYLRSANEVYGITSADVVFQGASVAFDLSMEEIWIPYLVGASLFVATPAVMGEADRLPEVMEGAGVTVLDTVPTLLALLPRDIASLRVIILGGEACPQSVAERWCRPGRAIFNSYGPTEATVVATVAEVTRGTPVTIGTPIPNYTCYIVDQALRPVSAGVEGELLIGGPGIATGYLKRGALTAEKFVANPFSTAHDDPVLYRSGDAVALDAHGNLLFRGRIDDQVKVRGFRVELGEIEAKLAGLPDVSQAAVVLRNDGGIDQLVAFLVAQRGATVDAKALRDDLRPLLPAYMIPARFEAVDELPRLSSGKVDRNALKRRALAAVDPDEQEEPRTATEAHLLTAAKQVLPPQAIAFDADFFTDLGGHSLLAARFVSLMRAVPGFAGLTLHDVYGARSLRAIGALLDGKAARQPAKRDLSFTPPPLVRRFLCGLAQAAVLPLILSLVSAQWLGVFVSYMLLTGTDASILEEATSIMGVYACINVATVALAIAAKWLIIGRTRPGRYPLWGVYYFRWWLVKRLLDLVHFKWMQNSPAARVYLRLLGARVGADAMLGEIDAGAIDLISIGAGTSMSSVANIANARVEGNELVIGHVSIGADVSIGLVLRDRRGCRHRRRCRITRSHVAVVGARVGAGELWDGSPGRRVGRVAADELDAMSTAGPLRRAVLTALYALALLIVPPLGLMPILPSFWVFDRIDDLIGIVDMDRLSYLASIPLMAWPTAFVMVIITVAFIAICRWVVLPRVREGTHSVHSFFYFRKWMMTLATEITLETLSSLFATIYMRNWYRLMGARIGKDAEISTNLSGRYDIVTIGPKCFIADEVVFGDEELRRGWMYLKKVQTGARVFVGNSAVVPAGAIIPDNALIGVKSKPPANEAMSENDTWFGSPPIKLPVRQRFDTGNAVWTYEAPWWKKSLRACFEAITISMPTMLFITFGTWAVDWFAQPLLDGLYLKVGGLYVVASVAICVALSLVVVVVKWLTMQRYEPATMPMWSWFAMRTEAVAVIYAGMAGKVLLDHLRGTPFLPWIMRLLGVHIGRGVYCNMTDITEFDCVTVGDFSSLNALCQLQTHLYEESRDEDRAHSRRAWRHRRRRLDRALRHACRRLRAARPVDACHERRADPR